MANLRFVKFYSLTQLGNNRTRTWGQNFTLQVQRSFQLNLPQMEGKPTNQTTCAVTFLVVQWLRLHAFSAGGWNSIPGQGTRFHMLQPRGCTPQLKNLNATMKTCCSQIYKQNFLKYSIRTGRLWGLLAGRWERPHPENLVSYNFLIKGRVGKGEEPLCFSRVDITFPSSVPPPVRTRKLTCWSGQDCY